MMQTGPSFSEVPTLGWALATRLPTSTKLAKTSSRMASGRLASQNFRLSAKIHGEAENGSSQLCPTEEPTGFQR